MPVETNKEQLCINQIIGQKIETTAIVEDFVVPDIKPDILNVINTSGTVCIYKKEVMDGKIKIDGCINAYVIYIADNENGETRSLNVNSNFSKIVEFEKAKPQMLLESEITLKQIECIVINGRKVSLKSVLDLNLKLCSNEKIEYIKQIEGVKNIQLLNENLSINSLLGTGNTKIYAKDTIVIDSIDDLAEIMKVNVQVKNSETKISYNKILVKADSEVKIMYLTQDNRIKCVTNIIPTMGFIDMPNITDDNLCSIKYEIKNLLVKPNSIEEHSIYVEIEIEASCRVYENKQLNLIQDLYSPSVNLTYKQKQIKAMSDANSIKEIYELREKQFIDEIINGEICDVDVNPTITNKTIMKDKIVFEGEINLNFIFKNQNSLALNSKQIVIPFNYNMDILGIIPSTQIETQMEISMQDFIVMPDSSIDIKIDIEFMVNSSNSRSINVIDELNVEENRDDNRYSVIIYFVKPGDTLWNIAKKFRSTIKDISSINGIEDENKIYVGDQLYIPFVNY